MTDLRTLERDSIRAFVQQAADDGYLSGRVLDYGCGKQPYRNIVEEAGGTYFPYDHPNFPGSTVTEAVGTAYPPADAVLCTQVVQYVPDVRGLLAMFNSSSRVSGIHTFVLTYPTNWPEVEPEDLHRFTKAGMERLLREAGFEIVRHERRATVRTVDFNLRQQVAYFPDEFALGYGVIARA